MPVLNEDSLFSKWARDDRIIRLDIGSEFSALRGSWKIVSAQRNGRAVPEYQILRWSWKLEGGEIRIDQPPLGRRASLPVFTSVLSAPMAQS